MGRSRSLGERPAFPLDLAADSFVVAQCTASRRALHELRAPALQIYGRHAMHVSGGNIMGCLCRSNYLFFEQEGNYEADDLFLKI